jgi:uncharacterized repeat protein (TIGR01451 family)
MGSIYNPVAALVALGFSAMASGQAATNPLSIKSIAEVETRTGEPGREASKLAPADKVVPGDHLIYTLEVRNSSAASLPAPTVIYPIPAHMWYVADSAVGPAADITYSVDGGRSFDIPENLKIPDPQGRPRAALAADYTHIRWQLKNPLKGNSVAFVRFRVVLKP